MKVLIVSFILLTGAVLTGCVNLEESIGIGPEDNGYLCILGDSGTILGMGTKLTGKRIEGPKGVTLTVDDAVKLMEACR